MQSAIRDGDGHAAEDDHAADRRGGRHERGLDGIAAFQLLPEAGDQEEAVVDRQPEAQAGDDVDREGVDVDDGGEGVEQQKRRQDREPADQHREQGRDEPPEDEEGEEQEERQGIELDPLQVVLRGLGELIHRDRGAADHDLGIIREAPLHLGPDLGDVRDVRRDEAEDERHPPIDRDQTRLGLRCDHPLNAVDASQLLSRQTGGRQWVAAARPDQQLDLGNGALSSGVPQVLVCA